MSLKFRLANNKMLYLCTSKYYIPVRISINSDQINKHLIRLPFNYEVFCYDGKNSLDDADVVPG